jgi:hypothetical protein
MVGLGVLQKLESKLTFSRTPKTMQDKDVL